MPLSNDVLLMSLVSVGICVEDVFFIISVCFSRFFEVVKCGCCRLFKVRAVVQVKVGNRYSVHSSTNRVDFVKKDAHFSQSDSPSPSSSGSCGDGEAKSLFTVLNSSFPSVFSSYMELYGSNALLFRMA